jgi:hypothetical protein
MKPDEATRKKRGFSLSFLSVRASPPMRFFFWTDSRPLTLSPPSIPSTHTRLVECGLDASRGGRGGAGVWGDPGAGCDRVRVLRRGSGCGAARGHAGAAWGRAWRSRSGSRWGLPSLEVKNAEPSTLPRRGGINLKGECYE